MYGNIRSVAVTLCVYSSLTRVYPHCRTNASTHRRIGAQAYWRTGVLAHGRMDARTHGRTDAWTHERMDARAHRRTRIDDADWSTMRKFIMDWDLNIRNCLSQLVRW
ncbi:hypothetical protein CRM22_003200 [Opisthorchis felineus]|uniref:Uncharacterized protein n=1 Tax=Opisthorchis felineus TaxID=147828 RepID=A0A4S2M778_OPIFE|nr:hypothetical protein CRM22_003200 [Opisthorchis felineus]